jgi:hypothetical protein
MIWPMRATGDILPDEEATAQRRRHGGINDTEEQTDGATTRGRRHGGADAEATNGEAKVEKNRRDSS